MKATYSPYENLEALWREADGLLPWAKSMIEDEPFLQDHLELAETYMDTVDALRRIIQPGDDRKFALGGLFLRTFDSMGHAIRAAMGGNYTGAAMYCRDLIETHFLLDYLSEDEKRPVEWLRSDQVAVRKKFSLVEIRKALDDRDGNKNKKRMQHYRVLSALGVHPSPQAFELKRDGTRTLNSGPFKQKQLLSECIQEVAKAALLLGDDLIAFSKEFPKGKEISSRLALLTQRTREKYLTSS